LILQGGAALKDSGIVKLAASGATLTIAGSETIGSLQGGGTTAIHSGQTLTIAETGNATYAGAITGAGALTKTGSGTLTLSGSNNHTGGTTLSSGTLQLLHANALGSGDLLLSSGTLAVGNASNSGGLLVPGHITWASSDAIVSLASTGNITTAGNFTHGGNVGNRTFDFGSGQHLQLGNNTIRSLTFANNGNLAIQAAHSLTLSQGQVAVENGTSLVSGGTLATPGNFNKTGAGELDVQSTLAVKGTASIDAVLLTSNGQLNADSVVVNPSATLGGNCTIVAPGGMTIAGTLSPGNSPGVISIVSNPVWTSTVTTLIEIASPSNYDRIVVTGTAQVAGTLNIVN
ncbi:MAG: autotransporter-associated beta strand repeat-containing protein, partial [Spartobacteria bacterium]